MDSNRLNMENKVKWQTLKYEELCKAHSQVPRSGGTGLFDKGHKVKNSPTGGKLVGVILFQIERVPFRAGNE